MESIIRRASLAAAPRRIGRPGPVLPVQAAPLAAAVAADAAPLKAPAPAQALPTAPTPDNAALREEALAAALLQLRREQEAAWQERLAGQEREHEEAMAALAEAERKLDADAASALAAARDEGLAQGAAQALAEARAQAAAELAHAMDAVRAAGAALDAERAALATGQEDMLVEIAFAAVCRVLGEQGATRSGIAGHVRSLLAQQAGGPVAVHLHPDDAELLAQHGGLGAQVQLCADPAVELGGCLLVSERGTLDARFEVQVAALRNALLEARARRAADEGGQ